MEENERKKVRNFGRAHRDIENRGQLYREWGALNEGHIESAWKESPKVCLLQGSK